MRDEGKQAELLSSSLRISALGAAINVVLSAMKVAGGIYGHSQALIADGLHSLSDLATDAVVALGLYYGAQPYDDNHPYGHKKIETLAEMVTGALLVVVAVWMVVTAVRKLGEGNTIPPAGITLVIAALSVVVKEWLYQATYRLGKKMNSGALVANAWHHRSDALSSVAVLLGVGAAHVNPNWHLADSFAALIVSFFILKVSASITWSAFKELADTVSSQEVIGEIRKRAMSVEGVLDAHDIIARQSGPHLLVEMHIVVNRDMTVEQGHTIVEMVERLLIGDMKSVNKVIIHVDPDTGVD